MPISFAASIISLSTGTFLSFPATSPSGTGTIFSFCNATIKPYCSFFISLAAAAPKRVQRNLSYAQGLPPLWKCPGTVTLIS